MKSYKERKERKEAQKYFRKNNDQFLNKEQWIQTLVPTIIWSFIIGAVYGYAMNYIPFESAILYLAIGIAIANVANAAAGVSNPHVGVAAVGCTILTYLVSAFVELLSFMPITAVFANIIPYFLSTNLLSWICMAGGCVVAYIQGSESRFM